MDSTYVFTPIQASDYSAYQQPAISTILYSTALPHHYSIDTRLSLTRQESTEEDKYAYLETKQYISKAIDNSEYVPNFLKPTKASSLMSTRKEAPEQLRLPKKIDSNCSYSFMKPTKATVLRNESRYERPKTTRSKAISSNYEPHFLQPTTAYRSHTSHHTPEPAKKRSKAILSGEALPHFMKTTTSFLSKQTVSVGEDPDYKYVLDDLTEEEKASRVPPVDRNAVKRLMTAVTQDKTVPSYMRSTACSNQHKTQKVVYKKKEEPAVIPPIKLVKPLDPKECTNKPLPNYMKPTETYKKRSSLYVSDTLPAKSVAEKEKKRTTTTATTQKQDKKVKTAKSTKNFVPRCAFINTKHIPSSVSGKPIKNPSTLKAIQTKDKKTLERRSSSVSNHRNSQRKSIVAKKETTVPAVVPTAPQTIEPYYDEEGYYHDEYGHVCDAEGNYFDGYYDVNNNWVDTTSLSNELSVEQPSSESVVEEKKEEVAAPVVEEVKEEEVAAPIVEEQPKEEEAAPVEEVKEEVVAPAEEVKEEVDYADAASAYDPYEEAAPVDEEPAPEEAAPVEEPASTEEPAPTEPQTFEPYYDEDGYYHDEYGHICDAEGNYFEGYYDENNNCMETTAYLQAA